MQNRIESQSVRWFDELATQFVRPEVDRDDTVPWQLYSSPYERIDVQEPLHAVGISASEDLVASDLVAQPRRRRRPRTTRAPAHRVSPLAMLLAAVAGASAFVLGVAMVTLLS